MSHNTDELNKAWKETGEARFLEAIKNRSKADMSDIVLNDGKFWQSAFEGNNSKNKVIICSDERVLPRRGEFKVGIAGQLVLASEKDKNNFIKRWKGKIKAVRSHDGCGAAGVAWEKLPLLAKRNFLQDNPDNNISEADLYGAVHSYNLAKALGAKFEHMKYKDMRGNKDFHDARMLFWSADPEFDPTIMVGTGRRPVPTEKYFPPHFLANGLAFGLSERYCTEELKILTSIALGSHGFGELFNKKNPFYIVCVGKDAKKLNEIAKKVLIVFTDRIKFKYYSK